MLSCFVPRKRRLEFDVLEIHRYCQDIVLSRLSVIRSFSAKCNLKAGNTEMLMHAFSAAHCQCVHDILSRRDSLERSTKSLSSVDHHRSVQNFILLRVYPDQYSFYPSCHCQSISSALRKTSMAGSGRKARLGSALPSTSCPRSK